MSRRSTGTVAWRGNPARWWVRLTVRAEDGSTKRPWVDLERPDLKHDDDGRREASVVALRLAKQHAPPTGINGTYPRPRSKKSAERALRDAIVGVGGIDKALEYIGRLTDGQLER